MTATFLELVNGGAVTPGAIWLALIAIYLSKETRRRGLRWFSWFHLPPSMDFMLAVFVGDVGVEGKAFVIWIWRRFFGAGEFNNYLLALLAFLNLLIFLGFLCKVRALTAPDHGPGPYMKAATWSAVAIAMMLVFR